MAAQQHIQRLIDFLKKWPFIRGSKAGRFIIECLAELQNVTWPSWPDVKSSTAVVYVTVIFMSVFMGVAAFAVNLLHGQFLKMLDRLLSLMRNMMNRIRRWAGGGRL